MRGGDEDRLTEGAEHRETRTVLFLFGTSGSPVWRVNQVWSMVIQPCSGMATSFLSKVVLISDLLGAFVAKCKQSLPCQINNCSMGLLMMVLHRYE